MGLTAEEIEVADQLRAILRAPGADEAYDAIAESLGGKILNADIARELSPRFHSFDECVAFTGATYAPARDYVFERFMRAVSEREDGLLMMLAGGAASGKSTSVRDIFEEVDLVFDSNCADFDKARTMIDTATGNGWTVFVHYIHRNFRVAVDSMLQRAIQCGRYIPLRCEDGPTLASLHFNAQRTFVRLADHYPDDGSVLRAAVRNPWTPDNPIGPTGISIRTLAQGGKRYYTSVEELYAVQDQVVGPLLGSGTIPQNLCHALGLC